jgi:hypothetical protein
VSIKFTHFKKSDLSKNNAKNFKLPLYMLGYQPSQHTNSLLKLIVNEKNTNNAHHNKNAYQCSHAYRLSRKTLPLQLQATGNIDQLSFSKCYVIDCSNGYLLQTSSKPKGLKLHKNFINAAPNLLHWKNLASQMQ